MRFLDQASSKKMLGVDTETTGLNLLNQGGDDYAMGVSVAYKSEHDYPATYFPFRHPGEGNLDDDVLASLRDVLQGASALTFHHAKFDLPSLETLGIDFQGQFYDTMLMAHLINENKPFAKSLNMLCRYYLGPDVHKEMHPALSTWINLFGWGSVTADAMYTYATQDAHITLPLGEKLYPLLMRELSNDASHWQHKQDMVRLLIKMKKIGARADHNKLLAKVTEADQRLAELEADINFKPTPTNLGKYFINELKLPVLKWTDGGKTGNPKPSFAKEVMGEYEEMLEALFPGNATVQSILAYRGWQKSRSAFYQSWIDHTDSDGRIRPDYIMHKDPDDGGTVSGRLSCKNPNLQQIPKVTNKEWNRDVKSCIIPEEGYTLVEADYSQLELRLSAAYAGEEELKRVFNEDRDIFDEMAARMGLTRDATKTFVYSTQYGAGVNRIKTVFRISESEAIRIRENYFAQYPGFHALALDASSKARLNGRVRIWSGRYRHFQNPKEESHKAMNSCIQGGAADIVERIMVKCDQTFVDWNNCRMLLQIHDAIVFEIKTSMLDHYLPLIKQTMESVNEIANFGVKFAVDVHRWNTKDRLI